ncbi:hypothetical protein Tco_0175023 [Tanacetum coccineum]
MVYEKFRLKTSGFSEWPKVHALASKNKSKSNDILLQNLRAKFQNLIPPLRVKGRRGLVIREPESEIFYNEAEELFKKLELTIEARDDANQAKNIVKDNLDGMGQHM